MNQARMPLVEALEKFTREEPAYFRIPGHRFLRGIDPSLQNASLAAFDLSEAEGLDDLHNPCGVIAKAQELAADLYGAKKAYFLVNGTTCGNEAMVLSAAREGEQVILPRNAHKSVLMGLIMSGAVPVYVQPEYFGEWQVWGGITPGKIKEAFERAPGAKAALVVSPTYYGIGSDLEAIAGICHENQALLLVDEAHGSHLYFSDQLQNGAIRCGADVSALSMHKTAGSFTQSSLLLVGSGRINPGLLEENLQMVQSTSPSYLLMASLDAARKGMALEGKERMQRALELSEMARDAFGKIPGVRVLDEKAEGRSGIYRIDLTRLVFSMKELGIGGYRLQELLYERFGVSTELSDEENVVAVITWANEEKDIQRLIHGVETLAKEADVKNECSVSRFEGAVPEKEWVQIPREIPSMCLTPREAYFADKRTVSFWNAKGCIAGEMIVPYPPGIPIVCPGERITDEILELIFKNKKNGCAFHGPADASLETIRVIR